MNIDPQVHVRRAVRGRAVVHSRNRHRNNNDNLGDVLLDLLHYAYHNGKDFHRELEWALKTFSEEMG